MTQTLTVLPPTALPANTRVLTIQGDNTTANNGTSSAAVTDNGISDAAAARFLAQASMGANRALIADVKARGYAGWIDAQLAAPRSGSRWDWLKAKGYDAATNKNGEAGFDACAWRKLIAAPDTLRQRVTLALSEICVVAIDGLVGSGWRSFSAAAYLDLLEDNAFGNYRTLLGKISTSAPMGQYLTYRGNVKQNPTTGALPDENYARELMQLFSIGLIKLNQDGTPQLLNGVPKETYGLDDITGLARVFTGWDFDLTGTTTATPDFLRRPMTQVAKRHETGSATFLGSTVPAGLSGEAALTKALDIIFAHQNVAPFISRQLIQKLVTSNPSAAYVARVAAVFAADAKNVRGNLAAVVKAILMDTEARNANNAALPGYGKLREPVLRFCAWARAYGATSASDAWAIGNTSDVGSRLGQSPLRSPSVFNFYRPGYVPPNSAVSAAGMVAPEFQLTNETTVVGYVNYMQRSIKGIGDVLPDYSSLQPLASNSAKLLDEINVVLAGGQLSAATLGLMRGALDTIAIKTTAGLNNRIYAALTLVLAAPEFLIQR